MTPKTGTQWEVVVDRYPAIGEGPTLSFSLGTRPITAEEARQEALLLVARGRTSVAGSEARMNDRPLPEICEALEAISLAHPEWRIGQCIVNALDIRPAPSLFHLADDEMLRRLREAAYGDEA